MSGFIAEVKSLLIKAELSRSVVNGVFEEGLIVYRQTRESDRLSFGKMRANQWQRKKTEPLLCVWMCEGVCVCRLQQIFLLNNFKESEDPGLCFISRSTLVSIDGELTESPKALLRGADQKSVYFFPSLTVCVLEASVLKAS